MISLLIRGGTETAKRFCQESRLFTLAESLGGVESQCEVPVAMTDKEMPEETREEGGVYDNLIRLSIGTEDINDLKADLIQVLEKAVSV